MVLAVSCLGLLAVPSASSAQSGGGRLSLAGAIDMALRNNRDIAAADAQFHGAGGQVREAWASVLPDIRANASYQRNFQVQEGFLPAFFFDSTAGPNDVIPVRFGADNSWQAGLTLTQPLFQVDAFIGLGTAARFRDLQSERVRGVTQNVVTSVRGAYFDVLLALEDERLTDLSVERVRQTLAETQAMNRAGLASDYDVLRLEVQLGNLEPNLRRARDAVAASTRSLAVVLGLNPETPLQLEGRLHQMVVGDPAGNSPENRAVLEFAGAASDADTRFQEAVDLALRDRSDIRQARLNVALERARYAVERADYFPKVSVFSNYLIQAQENGGPSFFGENSNQRTTAFNGGIRIELPIFTGFSQSARMQQAKANIVQNEALLDIAQRQTSSQIHTLVEALRETRQRVEAQRRAVGQAQRGYDIASAEYRAGVGTQLQITDAEVALRQSEFNYAQAVYDYLHARANLDAARGTVPVDTGDVTSPGLSRGDLP